MYNQNKTGNSNEYSLNSEKYRQSRPDYGKELYEFLVSLVPDTKLSWDCATGNGQAAKNLAEYFETVIATDTSQKQLNKAFYKKNISYHRASELHPDLKDNSVDLVTVATAIHWLNQKLFYKEAKRVLKPGGIIAIWGYTGKNINNALDPTLDSIIQKHLMPYYSDQIQLAFTGYQDLEFPFKKIESPSFKTQKLYSFSNLVDYMLSWSACQKYLAIHKQSPLFLFKEELKSAWGDVSQKKLMTWNLITYIGSS